MPHAYSTRDLHKTYEQIALKRQHCCDECGTKQRLSHSHLIHKSYYGNYNGIPFAVLEQNIVYHCLSIGNAVGCHDKFDSMNVAKMNNFEKYYLLIHEMDRKFFWKKMHALLDHWMKVDFDTYMRVRTLSAKIDVIERPIKTIE